MRYSGHRTIRRWCGTTDISIFVHLKSPKNPENPVYVSTCGLAVTWIRAGYYALVGVFRGAHFHSMVIFNFGENVDFVLRFFDEKTPSKKWFTFFQKIVSP